MKHIIQTGLKLFAIAMVMGVAVVLYSFVSHPTASVAALSPSAQSVCDGLPNGCGAGSGTSINNVITTVINIFSVIVGVAGVIMVIYAGFKYVTSAGDSGKLSSAKSTLIYALVGLMIAALAQFIVKFALASSTKTTCSPGYAYNSKTNVCEKKK